MDFSEQYNDSCSQVGMAARKGDIALLKKLLKENKDYCIKDNRGWFPIHEAAFHGHAECVQELLNAAYENDENPWDIWQSPFDLHDCNALVLATRQGHLETTQILSALYPTNSNDFAAGIEASLTHSEILQYLLSKFTGGINWQNMWKHTFLHSAVKSSSIKSLQILLNYGIDIEARDIDGRTALHLACETSRDDNLDVVKLLISKGSEVNTCDDKNCSALFVASQHGLLEIVKYLLQVNADPYLSFPLSPEFSILVAPILIAAERGHIKVLEEFCNCMSLDQILQKNILCPLISATTNSNGLSLLVLLQRKEYQEWLLQNSTSGKDLILEFFTWFTLDEVISDCRTFRNLKLLLDYGACIRPLCHKQDFNDFVSTTKIVESLNFFKLFFKHGYLEFVFMDNNYIPHVQKIVKRLFDFYNKNPKEFYNFKHNMILLLEFLPVIKYIGKYNDNVKITDVEMIVPSLLCQTRFCIRKHLLKIKGHINDIELLPLPHFLKQYLFSAVQSSVS